MLLECCFEYRFFCISSAAHRKVDSSDMQDLVQMMTQTLKMAGGDGACEVEFKLNRKYRDTLVLHGKAQQEAKDLSLSKISIGELIKLYYFKADLSAAMCV